MGKYVLWLFFVGIPLLCCQAQTVLKGTVTDTKGEVCPDISVVILTADDASKMLGYALTDERGRYSIQFQTDAEQVKIRLVGFNIRKVEVILPNRSTTYDCTVHAEAIRLKEVDVRVDKITQQGDTLNYNVASFMSGSDSSIGEVLRRMPGITVRPSGTIEYKGKAISQFYIEGMDLLKGRYGIATNNLDPSQIATVQVLENHQEVKALKGVHIPDAAAINLKLKEGAKGVFNLMAQLGIGADGQPLWENELTGTYFTQARQHLATYKGNDSGKNLWTELSTQTGDQMASPARFMQMQMPAPPGIEQSKYYFNQSNAASVNNIWRGRKGRETNLNLVYLNDHEHRDSYAQTLYLMPGESESVLDETMRSATTLDRLEGTLAYKRNEETAYLNNETSFSGEWERGYSRIVGETPIHQASETNTFQLTNRLNWIRKKSMYKGMEIVSKSSFGRKPQHLRVSPNQFAELSGGIGETVWQEAVSTRFASENHFSLLTAWVAGNLRISPVGILALEYDKLESELSGLPVSGKEGTGADYRNDNELYHLKGGFGCRMEYHAGRFRSQLYLPFLADYSHLKQQLGRGDLHDFRLLLSPVASANYRINGQWEASATYLLNYGHPEMQQLYEGYLLTSYRMLNSFEASLEKSLFQHLLLQVDHKDIARMLFAGIKLGYATVGRARSSSWRMTMYST